MAQLRAFELQRSALIEESTARVSSPFHAGTASVNSSPPQSSTSIRRAERPSSSICRKSGWRHARSSSRRRKLLWLPWMASSIRGGSLRCDIARTECARSCCRRRAGTRSCHPGCLSSGRLPARRVRAKVSPVFRPLQQSREDFVPDLAARSPAKFSRPADPSVFHLRVDPVGLDARPPTVEIAFLIGLSKLGHHDRGRAPLATTNLGGEARQTKQKSPGMLGSTATIKLA